jgi:DNA (cytosine-5)-methyltransferase 1
MILWPPGARQRSASVQKRQKRYYGDSDPTAAEWLRRLISRGILPMGDVDERSIAEVTAADLMGYEQCHFFAGIGGWPLALKLAGWTGPVWTGSCPCRPFSSAARGRHSERDMWPHFRSLISARAPRVVFGEQVASARNWFDGVCDDLEAMGYSIGAAILPACGIGFDHARPRIYFVGHSDRESESGCSFNAKVARLPRNRSNAGGVAPSHGVSGRVGRLRAYGNAIVPALAAEFVRATMEAIR